MVQHCVKYLYYILINAKILDRDKYIWPTFALHMVLVGISGEFIHSYDTCRRQFNAYFKEWENVEGRESLEVILKFLRMKL